MKQTGSKIQKKVLIQAAPAIVFKALTDARDLMRWFCDHATSDPVMGGTLMATWKSGKKKVVGRAVYTHITQDENVELLWVDDGEGDVEEIATHVLSYTIRKRQKLTEVVMCDMDETEPEDEALAILHDGWNNVLLELKDHCEKRERSGKGRTEEAS